MKKLFLLSLLILPAISVAAPVTVEQRGIAFSWDYPYPSNPDGFKIDCNGIETIFPDGALRLVSMPDVNMSSDAQQSCVIIAYGNYPQAGYLEGPRSGPITNFFTRAGVPMRTVTVDSPGQPGNFGAIWENVVEAGN